ncbi:MAG TPA: hypothetical protein VIO14_13640 [Dehalococcoidia bacterium]
MKDVSREALVALPARREMNPIVIGKLNIAAGLAAGVNISTATAVEQAVTNIGVLVGGLP